MRRKMVWALALLALLLYPLFALSQTNAVTYQLKVYAAGTDPLTAESFYTLDMAPAIVECSTTTIAPASQPNPINPTWLYWSDPDMPGTNCRANLAGTTFVEIQEGGPYPFTLTKANVVGRSPKGAGENPFSRLNAPARALTTIRLSKS